MKLQLFSFFLALLAAFVLAAEQPQRQIIVSYPKHTPYSVLEAAKKAIIEAGGVITHEYTIILGFAAKAPARILDTIHTMGADHKVVIEEDQTVSVNGS